ncbi:MAG: hypothetical protein A2284_05220 [Deltaproteobacteria bacterium RIFOXYA12_FULL_61_11]|nr:MAG: hypothetical protein A2284_05220 [Deltaproteobacteria bacterium RIFOXYA12_FULL_61_11]
MTPLLHEVGPRDGLQAEREVLPLERKALWIEAAAAAGLDLVQVGSFVHPQKVPQLADTDRLFSLLAERGRIRPGVVLSALALNEKGLERALACKVGLLCLGVSASETHSRRNTGMSTGEAAGRILAIAADARREGVEVQLSVQSAFGCGYEGEVPEERVLALVERYLGEGHRRISLADTAGLATPDRVERLFSTLREQAPDVEFACHFHDHVGLGLVNCYAALKAGVRCFESAFAGLGGCPFTRLAAGNVATEDLSNLLARLGLRADLDLRGLTELAAEVAAHFGRQGGSLVRLAAAKAAPVP